MFERFTQEARSVVVGAQDEARSLGHGHIGTEHLLLALLDEERGLAARVLADAGVGRDEVAIEPAPPGIDSRALAAIGIDLDAVRARIEEAFGPGALERRRVCNDGSIPFRPEAKKALEIALRESKALRDDYIGTEHLLLALAREEQPPLARHGLSHERVLALVRD
jgi:ATP-dependent Clp protease ATP-binding subunit ClpA